ncbi:exopolysaccharide biosynthesis protein [Amaricoccus sp.]|uniref:exopolysaccharide biosynthesis protein n=1 Tax=Amaricoccus sp. TaxID=1872485 RepID=UPI0026057D67|nr:exopolysaccharide biosynthesis protein [Amaricoccus sp.]HRO11602.1 exopolysaccharide biosynthesis protein [Amaricoccus sp.]
MQDEAPTKGPDDRAHRRISAILRGLVESAEGERISIGDMVDAFDARAYGPLIALFAAPNVLPVALPGISAVLGAPLILLTAQLMVGLRRPWLPVFLRRRSLARGSFESLVGRIVPRLVRIEAMTHPRLLPLTSRWGERMIGAVGLLLAAIVFLPVPFGNALPGVALMLMGVGLIARDGLLVVAGGLLGVAGVAVVSGFLYGIVAAATHLARIGLGI